MRLPSSRLSRPRPVLQPLAIAAGLLLHGAVGALPQGEQLVFGQAQVQRPQTGQLRIEQQSQRAGLDWRSFNIAAGEQVLVQQPSSQAVLVNRVLGDDPSAVFGSLQANGRVFLSNPRGILFGAGSVLDVGGLVATTLQFADPASNDRLVLLQGGGSGELRAEGEIRSGGLLALVAPRLSVNGQLSAPRVGLAAADAVQVDVEGDGLVFFNMRGDQLANRLELLGRVEAGNAELRAAARAGAADTVLNLEGIVRAQGLGTAPGRIVVDGGAQGAVRVAGGLDVSAAQGRGGEVEISGAHLRLDDGSRIDARGSSGGGTVLVGGDWQGGGPLPHAKSVRLATGAEIDASASADGNGGKVVLWSSLSLADGLTQVDGRIRATGAGGGLGGRVETSGARLGVRGRVDAGRDGLWLLDPWTITVVGDGSGIDTLPGNNYQPTSDVSVDAAAVNAALVNANVTLDAGGAGGGTDGNIIIDGAISWSSNRNLTLLAAGAGGISGSGTITNTAVSSTPTLTIFQDGNSTFQGSFSGSRLAFVKTGSGKLTLTGANNPGQGSTINGGSIGLSGVGASLGSASINLNANTLDLSNGASIANDIQIDDEALITSSSGGGTLASGGALEIPNNGDLRLSSGGAGTLTVNRVISDNDSDGRLFVTGGTVLLTRSNSFDGNARIASGATLALSGASANAGTATIVFDSATSVLDIRNGADVGNNLTFTSGARVISAEGGGTLGVKSGDNPEGIDTGVTLTLAGSGGSLLSVTRPLTGDGSLRIDGGTVLLTRDSDFVGGTVVNSGTLRISGSGADAGSGLINLGANTLDLVGGVNISQDLQLSSGARITSSSGIGTLSGGSLALGASDSLLLSGSGGELRISRPISNAAGAASLTVDGGSVVLSGANAHTGLTTVSGSGTLLAIANDSALGTDAAGTTVGSGSTLELRGVNLGNEAITLNGGSLLAASGSNEVGGPITLGGHAVIGGAAALTLSGAIGGGFNISKTGSGTLTLDAANSYGGTTTVNAGTLSLGPSGSLPAGTALTISGVSSQVNLNEITTTLASLSGDGGLNLGAAGNLTVGDASNFSFSGLLAGGGPIVKQGSGAWTLSGANSFSGQLTVNDGSLIAASSGALGSTAGATVLGAANALLELQGVNIGAEALNLGLGTLRASGASSAVSGAITVGATTATIQVDGSLLTLSGAVGGVGGFNKTGSGSLLLSGSGSSFDGALNVNAGTLAISHASALGSTAGASTVASGATLELRGVSLGGETINLNGGSLLASNANSSLAGSLVLSGNSMIEVGSSLALTLDGVVSGTGGFSKTGSGSLRLNGANSYDGGTQLSAGLLIAAHATALGSTVGGTSAASGTTLQLVDIAVGAEALSLNGATLQASGLATSLAGAITLSGSNSIAVDSGQSLTLSGVISGSGELSKSGGGELVLAGANSYDGSTAVNAGRVAISQASGLGSTAAGTTVASGATLELRGVLVGAEALALDGATLLASGGNSSLAGAVTLSGSNSIEVEATRTLSLGGQLGGSGGFTKTGAGSLVLGAANSYGGATTVSAGLLSLGVANALPASTALTLNASLNGNSTSWTIASLAGSGSLDLGAAGALTVGNASDTSFSGTITGGALTKTGSGTLTLSGANTHSGTTTVNAGTLAISHADALGSTAAGTVVASGARLQLQGAAVGAEALTLNGGTLASNTAASSLAGGISLGSDSSIEVASGQQLSLSGVISGSAGLTKTGAGNLVLSNTNSYGGATTVSAGQLSLTVNNALPSTTALTLNATLNANSTAWQIGSLAGSGSLALGATGLLTVGDGSNSLFSGSISGGALTKVGSGTLTLSGANSHSGLTTVSAGSLAVAHASALGGTTAGTVVANGATLSLHGVAVGAEAITLSGILSGGSGSSSLAGSVDLASATARIDVSGSQLSLSGAVSGANALVKQGSGSLLLAAANSYSGGTELQAGLLRQNAAGALPAGGALSIASGATLQLGNLDASTGSLAGNGQLELGSATLSVNNAGAISFAGVISGSGGLIKQGSGTLTLSGANSYTGSTDLQAGVLQIGNGGGSGSLASGSLQLASGSELRVNRSGSLSLAGDLSGSGTLRLQGGASLSLSGANNSHGGLLQIDAGSLIALGGSALGDAATLNLAGAGSQLEVSGSEQLGLLQADSGSQLLLNPGASLTLALSGSHSLAGALSGSGSLRIAAGSALLSGSSPGFSGLIELTGGDLSLAASHLLGDGASLRVNSATSSLELGSFSDSVASLELVQGEINGSGTLTATNYNLQAGSVNAHLGAGTLSKTGSGTVLLAGSSGASSSTISDGTLRLLAADRLSNAVSVNGTNAVLDLGAFDNSGLTSFTLQQGLLAGSGRLSAGEYLLRSGTVNANLGAGTLRKQQAGVVTLVGDSQADTIEVLGGELRLGNHERLLDTAALRVDTALFNLQSFNERVGSVLLENGGATSGSGVLSTDIAVLLAGDVNGTLNSNILRKQGNGTVTLLGNSLATLVEIEGGTLRLGAAQRLNGSAELIIENGARFDLQGFAQNLVQLSLVDGHVDGSGLLTLSGSALLQQGSLTAPISAATAAKTGSGTLTLNGLLDVPQLRVEAGSVELGAAQRLDADARLVLDGATAQFALGNFDQTVAGFELRGGATLAGGSGQLSTTVYELYDGVVSGRTGAGELRKLGSGSVTLSGQSAATTVLVSAGSLSLGDAERLANGAQLRIEGGSIDLGANNETIGSLLLQDGLLAGSGTLSATSYSLRSGTVNANLGAGALTKTGSGTVLLAGSSGATTTLIEDGRLQLAAADRLANALTINGSNAVLDLGAFSNSVASLDLVAGSLNGSGTLTAANTTLRSGTVNANLGSGALTKTGSGTVLLAGSSSAATTLIEDGRLQLAAADRLANAVTINGSNAVLDLGAFSNSVASLDLVAGSLEGSGTLTAANTTLRSGAVNANLGAGTLTKTGSGTVLLAGTSNADSSLIEDGTLRLLAADRLANLLTVNGANAVLDLGAFSDSVASLDLVSGRLDGTGTLTAPSYTLRAGTVNANLGPGALTKSGNSTVLLAGSSGALTVDISAGTLQLLAAERLANDAQLRLDGSSARLNLGGFAETVGGLQLRGGSQLTGGGSLATGEALLSEGLVDTALQTALLRKQEAGSVTMLGSSNAGRVELSGGSLLLGADQRLASNAELRVENGASLQLNGFTQSLDSLLLVDGSLLGGGSLQLGRLAELQQGRVESALAAPLLRKSGDGELQLAGSATVARAELQGGLLRLESAQRLSSQVLLEIDAGARLQLQGDQTLGSLAGRGEILLGNASLRTGSAGDSRFDGQLSGSGRLIKQGDSRLLIGNALANTGGTLIEAGELRLVEAPGAGPLAASARARPLAEPSSGGSLGSGEIRIEGVLAVERSRPLTLTQNLVGGGQLHQLGGGELVLSGDNSYSGGTRIAAGSLLQIGDGGSRGSLGSGAVDNAGLLAFARSDSLTLNQRVSGSGAIEQRGSGQLSVQTPIESTGELRVSQGSLATAGADRLQDGAQVRVSSGAQLLLAGNETLGGVDAEGLVRLAGHLTSSGEQRFAGGLRLEGSGPQSLVASRILAENAAENSFGAQALSLQAGEVLINSASALSLGRLQLSGGGQISAPTLQLDGELLLSSGSLSLLASRAPGADGYSLLPDGKISPNDRALAVADATLRQGSSSVIRVDAGANLLVAATGGGSIELDSAENRISGSLSVRSGEFGEPWSDREDRGGTTRSNQSQILLAGRELQIGGSGLEADLIRISADRLQTREGASIVARLPFNNDRGTLSQVPALTLVLGEAAFAAPESFGNAAAPLQIRVGVQDETAGGARYNAGLIAVQPQPAPDGGRTAIFAAGPTAGASSASYRFFYPGAGIQTETPIIFNGIVPTTPEVLGTLSATVAVSESARKERFEEAVRTENVALRLKAGVIAEVGPGRPATSGGQGLKLPEICPPGGALLACAETPR